jgi:dephospho-CoA kinase
MLIVGIAGGIASGKSYVASLFQDLGAGLIEADKLGHEVLRSDIVKREVVGEFGEAILNTDGEIDRNRLAKLVFGDDLVSKRRLVELERITHPRIELKIREQLAEFKSKGFPALIFDAAVMFKAGWDQVCDKILFVECSESIRLKRATERGWTSEQFYHREAQQLPVAKKRQRATDIVFNDPNAHPSIEDQIRNLWVQWQCQRPNTET